MSKFPYNPPYAITGQAGAALDVTGAHLDTLGIDMGEMEFHSMRPDRVRWIQRAGTPPDYLQEISIHDASGTCVFRGNVTAIDELYDGTEVLPYQVEVSGPWWWLEQTQLTALATDDLGSEQERAEFLVAQQDLKTSLEQFMQRITAVGIPLRLGNVDPTFTVPQMTFQNMSAASALVTMLGWVPDAMTSIRYDGDGGLPLLDVTRRPTATITTFQLGGDNDLTGIPSLRAIRSLRPETVRVQSMSLDANGDVQFVEQVAGAQTPTSQVGQQILTLAGAGRPGYRQGGIGKVKLKTLPITSDAEVEDLFYKMHTGFASLASELYSIQTGSVNFTIIYNDGFQTFSVSPIDQWFIDDTPSDMATVLDNAVIVGDLPDWWAETGIAAQRVRLKRSFIYSAAYSSATGPPAAALADSVHDTGTDLLYIAQPEIEFWAIDQAYAAETVVVRPRDLALVTPITNLAKNLYDAQNFATYEGQIPLHPGSVLPLPGEVVNIRGAVSGWETMRAMVRECRIDLDTGAAILQVGRSGRTSANALLDQFSSSTSGRIINI